MRVYKTFLFFCGRGVDRETGKCSSDMLHTDVLSLSEYEFFLDDFDSPGDGRSSFAWAKWD